MKALPLTTPASVSVFAAVLMARLAVPRSTLPASVRVFVPRKLASAERTRLFAMVSALEVSSEPPAKLSTPVPSAPALPRVSRPSTSLTPPSKVLALVATRAPAPVLVRPKPVPEITPAKVSEVVAPVPKVLIAEFAPTTILAPAAVVRENEPPKAKSPLRLIAPVEVSVWAAVTVSMRPPLRFSAPVPRAAALPTKSRPPLTVVAPEVVFAPEIVNEPALRIAPPV